MTTAIERSWMEAPDELPAEIPGAANLEPGRLAWLHGANQSGVRTSGVFYGRDTAFAEPPTAPWVLDERYIDQDEIGYSAPELRIAFIGSRSQWFRSGEDRSKPPEWLPAYVKEDGVKLLTEYLILIDGLYDPMVLSVSGLYKSQPIADILSNYRRGALAQAMRKVKRTLPPWAFWLPIANKRTSDGKTVYIKATDADGKEYGSVVTPPALAAAPVPVTLGILNYGSELWQQYQEWFKFKRLPRGTEDGHYEEVKQLPAGKNVPEQIEEGEIAPF